MTLQLPSREAWVRWCDVCIRSIAIYAHGGAFVNVENHGIGAGIVVRGRTTVTQTLLLDASIHPNTGVRNFGGVCTDWPGEDIQTGMWGTEVPPASQCRPLVGIMISKCYHISAAEFLIAICSRREGYPSFTTYNWLNWKYISFTWRRQILLSPRT